MGVCSECGGSIQFPAELVGTMTTCPRCRKQTELTLAPPLEEPAAPRKALMWSVVAIVILALGSIVLVGGLKHFEKVAGIRRGRAALDPVATTIGAAGLADFQVWGIALEKGQGKGENYAVCRVVNKSNRTRSGVTLELNLLDADGQEVGVLRGYRPALEAEARWDSRVPVSDTNAASVTFRTLKEGP